MLISPDPVMTALAYGRVCVPVKSAIDGACTPAALCCAQTACRYPCRLCARCGVEQIPFYSVFLQTVRDLLKKHYHKGHRGVPRGYKEFERNIMSPVCLTAFWYSHLSLKLSALTSACFWLCPRFQAPTFCSG